MKKCIRVTSAKETEEVGFTLAKSLRDKGISKAFIALFGEMGVGKTAFSRGFASYFEIRSVKSPTYTVLNEYRGSAKVHHFDFYRITDGDDLYSIGIHLLYTNRMCTKRQIHTFFLMVKYGLK